MNTYKNKTDRTLVLPGIGVIKPNGTIQSEKLIENPNIERISDGDVIGAPIETEVKQVDSEQTANKETN